MNSTKNNNNTNLRTRVRRKGPGLNTRNALKSEVGINVAARNPKQNLIQPEFRMQRFRWQADYGNITNAGSAYAGKMMYANNLYDPDPALLSSGVAGFADNMDFYFYCLPITSLSRVIVTNREAFPVKVCLLFSIQQADLLFSSSQNIIDLGENSISTRWIELAAQGGQDRAILQNKVNLGQANGNELEYNGNAQTYSCDSSSGPPFPMFWSLLVWSTSNLTSAGVGVSWSIEWTCRLWSRRLVLDSGPTLAKKLLLQQIKEKDRLLKITNNKLMLTESIDNEQFNIITRNLQSEKLQLTDDIEHLKSKLDKPYQD